MSAQAPAGQGQELNNVMSQMEQIGISNEHLQDVQGINKYLQDHRINQLFNVSGNPKLTVKPECDFDCGSSY